MSRRAFVGRLVAPLVGAALLGSALVAGPAVSSSPGAETLVPVASSAAAATPTRFQVSSNTTTSVGASWSGSAAKYRLWYGTNPDGSGATKLEVSTNSATITGLAPGTTYYVSLAGLNASGTPSAYTARALVMTPAETGPPATPQHLSFDSSSSTTATANWDAVPGASRYRFSYGTRPDGTGATVKDGVRTLVQISGLKPSTTYYTSVASLDASGTSTAPSKQVLVTTPAATGSSALTPTGFALGEDSPTSMTVYWNPFENPKKYRIWYGTNPSGAGATKVEGAGAVKSIGGLEPETTYYVSMATLDGSGTPSRYTVRLQVTTPALGAVPSTPEGLLVRARTSTEIRPTWGQVRTAFEYVVRYGTQADGSGATVVKTRLPYQVISGLTPGSTYYVSVAARTQAGEQSQFSEPFAITMPATGASRTPTGFEVAAASPTSVRASWNAVADTAAYRVWIGTRADGKGAAMIEPDPTSQIITGLKPGTTYYLSVAALTGTRTPGTYTSRLAVTTPLNP